MKKNLFTLLFSYLLFFPLSAEDITVFSPDKNLQVQLSMNADKSVVYAVTYKNKVMLEESPLGLITNESDFSRNLSFVEKSEQEIHEAYFEK